MTDHRACRTCSFFVGDDKGGECHRGPPTAVTVPERRMDGKMMHVPSSFFPPVTAASWCGEWVITTKLAVPSDVVDLAGKLGRAN